MTPVVSDDLDLKAGLPLSGQDIVCCHTTSYSFSASRFQSQRITTSQVNARTDSYASRRVKPAPPTDHPLAPAGLCFGGFGANGWNCLDLGRVATPPDKGKC